MVFYEFPDSYEALYQHRDMVLSPFELTFLGERLARDVLENSGSIPALLSHDRYDFVVPLLFGIQPIRGIRADYCSDGRCDHDTLDVCPVDHMRYLEQ